MSRPLRIEYAGAWYHVMNRGRRREDIFLEKGDYRLFLEILRETSKQWNLEVSAYCLMPNHYHLLVRTPDGNLSRCMRHLNGVYTQRFNRKHALDGQLFCGRYKAVLVEDDSHLLELLRYIHRNPLPADLAEHLGNYPWSSHKGYLAGERGWGWLNRDVLLKMLSKNRKKAFAAYLDFVAQKNSAEIEAFYSLKNLSSIFGSTEFINKIKNTFKYLREQKDIPEIRILFADFEVIIASVCNLRQVDRSEILTSRRGVGNISRDMAIYLMRLHSHKTLHQIGAYFNIDNYSTVSTAISRFKKGMEKDRKLRHEIDKINVFIAEGQP